MTRIDQTAAAKTWTEQNNAGNGYSVGNDGADINDLTAELGELVTAARTDRDVAIYRTTAGSLVFVGDSYGPWAVDA